MDGNDGGLTSLSASVRQFLSQPKKALINGKWLEARNGKTFEVLNPATGERIARVAECEKEDVDQAVRAARNAFDAGPWRSMSPSQRGRILWRIGDLIERDLEDLAQLESLDNGKPIVVARAADVTLAADLFRYMAGWATKIEGETISLSVPYTPGAEYHAYTRKEPIGVVGQIIPWNFPLLMAAWKVGPALATGCTVVLKLAEETPLSGLKLAELCQEAGLPDGVLNVVTGFGESCGAPLAAHPLVDKVAFTGSTEVGKLIVKAAAHDLKKLTLELGVDTGDRIRLTGEGERGERNAPPGDLYVQVQVKPHPLFERDGSDLYCTVPVSIVTAALGGEMEVPTLSGKATLKISESTQSGKVFRLRGLGVKPVRGGAAGDLLCNVVVETPVHLTKKQKDLLRELGESLGEKKHSPQTSSWLDKAKQFFDEHLKSS